MLTHILGFPRIGKHRELKKALEGYWKSEISQAELYESAANLKKERWTLERDAGLSFVTAGDFSFYDHMLDASVALGVIPTRFQEMTSGLDRYFAMARGDVARNIPAMEMTKWFNTNYHYIVPEVARNQLFTPTLTPLFEEIGEARRQGFRPKPVLVGPVTWLALAKERDGASRWDLLPALTECYATFLQALAERCEWIQIDEPVLCTDMPEFLRKAFLASYHRLRREAPSAKTLLTTYFGTVGDNLDLALQSECSGLHLDLSEHPEQLSGALAGLPEEMSLSLGVVNGRNIWKTDCAAILPSLQNALDRLGENRLLLGSSCSLLHVPVDLELERHLDPEIRNWLSFAVQKCDEIVLLARTLCDKGSLEALEQNRLAMESRHSSPKAVDPAVRERCRAITPEMHRRSTPYALRCKIQDKRLHLPLFPTTTIGSFPQTETIRRARQGLRKGTLSKAEYEAFLKKTIRETVAKQEELGLDVLVHGEPERVDMVEYFGQQLEGFCFTEAGWVQSYGSRCVKPPVLYGDVSRKKPMTVAWLSYAQSLTQKPMKGMLTGPVTILCWSFVRDDLKREDVCRQIALALRDEVLDLEKAGLKIIQIDEAALREGLPLRKKEGEDYLRWAIECFRLAVSGVREETQIHTHMCYSEFNAILKWIAAMDADVISIEASRSDMELLQAFVDFNYPSAIGPGVYDIHSPRVPGLQEIAARLEAALRFIAPEKLWVNPDCGLKTRDWPETLSSLKNMVQAAQLLRRKYTRQAK